MLPAGLVVTTAVADLASAPELAFYVLVAAVPAAAAAALSAYGDLVEGDDSEAWAKAQALLAAAVLGLMVLGAAARSPALGEHAVPAVGRSALVCCLALLLIQVVGSGVAEAIHGRRGRRRYSAIDAAAFSASSISGWTAKNEPTVTTRAAATAVERSRSRGGEPPAGASWSSAEGRMYIARTTAR